jgi:hypothetical protein
LRGCVQLWKFYSDLAMFPKCLWCFCCILQVLMISDCFSVFLLFFCAFAHSATIYGTFRAKLCVWDDFVHSKLQSNFGWFLGPPRRSSALPRRFLGGSSALLGASSALPRRFWARCPLQAIKIPDFAQFSAKVPQTSQNNPDCVRMRENCLICHSSLKMPQCHGFRCVLA